MRILHIFGKMDVGGAESWAMNLFRLMVKEGVIFDFMVHTDEPGYFDEEIRQLGGKIYINSSPQGSIGYIVKLVSILRSKKYKVVHSHVHFFSGFITTVAMILRIPVRIAHSHSDSSILDRQARPLRKGYLRLMRTLIELSTTHGIAVSYRAASALFGPRWESNPKCQIIYCGVNLECFQRKSPNLKKDLGIEEDSFVIGQIGRLVPLKNHRFTIDTFHEILKSTPCATLLIIGDGPEYGALLEQVRDLNIEHNVVFLGNRSDIAQIMSSVLDFLILPSFYEGLPMVVIESQAAGIPAVISDNISKDVEEVRDLVSFTPLSLGSRYWAELIMDKRSQHIRSYNSLRESRFDISVSSENILKIYSNGK